MAIIMLPLLGVVFDKHLQIWSIMDKNYDAIIIGSGIIGCSIAFELGKLGWNTLNVDKLSAAGNGSTANT